MKDYREIAEEVFWQRDRYDRIRKGFGGFGWCIRKFFLWSLLTVCLCAILTIGYLFGIGSGFLEDQYDIFQKIPGIRLIDNQTENDRKDPARIGSGVTSDGITVTMQSAIRDGTVYYFLLNIEAPEDIPLESYSMFDYQRNYSLQFKKLWMEDGNGNGCWLSRPDMTPLPDLDNRSNTLQISVRADTSLSQDNHDFSADRVDFVTLTLTDLRLYDYLHVLKDQDETLDGLHPLASGEWKFQFLPTPLENTGEELVRASFEAMYQLDSGDDLPVSVQSVRLTPLGLELTCTFADATQPTAGNFGEIRCVLEDETVIYPQLCTALTEKSAGKEYSCTYCFEIPFQGKLVDHLILNETELPNAAED